jgi:hypothetical protein
MVFVKHQIIEEWFEKRFQRKPKSDDAYFKEWVDRFSRAEKIDDIYPMDLQSKRDWNEIRKKHKLGEVI